MKTSALVFGFLSLFLFAVPCFAASLSVSSPTSQIKSTDEFEVSVSLSINAATGSAYFLRGVFFLPNKSDYCGYTWNGSSWFNGPYSSNEGWKNFLPITINNNLWQGKLKAKVDSADSGCKTSGTYYFKIQRFTGTGSSTFDPQNALTINIDIPSQTPTPTPTPKPAKQVSTTSNPTPTKSLDSELSNDTYSEDSLGGEENISIPEIVSSESSQPDVLGISANPTSDSAKINLNKPSKQKPPKIKIFGIIFAGLGVILLVSCAIVAVIIRRKHDVQNI